jgi:hypothetical protein
VRVDVVVDGLPQEGDLDDTVIGEALALVDDVVRRPVHLGPAREGDHAIRAELVAPAGDPYVGARVPPAAGGEVGIERTGKIQVLQVVGRRAQDG